MQADPWRGHKAGDEGRSTEHGHEEVPFKRVQVHRDDQHQLIRRSTSRTWGRWRERLEDCLVATKDGVPVALEPVVDMGRHQLWPSPAGAGQPTMSRIAFVALALALASVPRR